MCLFNFKRFEHSFDGLLIVQKTSSNTSDSKPLLLLSVEEYKHSVKSFHCSYCENCVRHEYSGYERRICHHSPNSCWRAINLPYPRCIFGRIFPSSSLSSELGPRRYFQEIWTALFVICWEDAQSTLRYRENWFGILAIISYYIQKRLTRTLGERDCTSMCCE